MFSFPHKMILYSKLSIIKYTFIEKKIIRFAIFLSDVYLLTTSMCIGNMHGHMRRPERSPDCTNGEESTIQRYRV